MSTITGKEVWSAFEDLPQMRGKEALLAVLKPFVEKLPEILSDQLDNRVTFTDIAQARLDFLRFLLDSAYAHQSAKALSKGWFNEDKIIGWVKDDLQAEIDKLMNLLINPKVFLYQNGFGSRETVMVVLFGMAEVKMTIGELLLKRPELIAHNAFSSMFHNA